MAPEAGPRDVTLIVYGHVRPTHVGADGAAWELAEALEAAGRLDKVVCCRFDARGKDLPAHRFETPGRRVFALGSLLLDRLGRWLPGGPRRYQERLFDWLVSRSKGLEGARCVVFRKPNFERTARALAGRGVPTLAIASICHPRMNRDRVRAEAARLGIDDHSPYTDAARVGQLEAFFTACARILTTERVGETSFADHGIPRARIITTPLMNGADCQRFTPREGPRPDGPLRFFHLSAMNLIKGVGLLFEAWRDLALEDAELWLGGSLDESSRAAFDRIAPPSARLLGPVADSPERYREVDVFVSPSLSDSAPNTVLEALASGLPVIVSDACGASRIVRDGIDGFVYPWDDREALADRLRWCASHRDALAEMGRAARQTALANPRSVFAEHVLAAIDATASSGA